MELNALIQEGWAQHHQDAAGVAKRLTDRVGLVADSEGAAKFMNLVNHCIGGHLKDRERARALCEAAARRLSTDVEPAAALYLAVARRLVGDEDGAREMQARLGEDEPARIRVDMLVCEGHMNEGDWPRAQALYETTLATAEALAPGHEAERAVAVVSNNVASELLELPSRTPPQDAFMERAALAAHMFWSRIGTWINSERADYLLSMVYTALHAPDKGLHFAERGLQTIADADGEEPVDEAFLHLARARACRDSGNQREHKASLARAKELATGFDEGLRSWFDGELAKSL